VQLAFPAQLVHELHAVDPTSKDIDLAVVNRDPSVYLAPVFDTQDEFIAWLEESVDLIFEEQLGGWRTDEASWPANRSIEVFKKWFGLSTPLERIKIIHNLNG
jgi:hypothetical protein